MRIGLIGVGAINSVVAQALLEPVPATQVAISMEQLIAPYSSALDDLSQKILNKDRLNRGPTVLVIQGGRGRTCSSAVPRP